MKKLICFLLICCSLTCSHSQNKIPDFVKSLGGGYYSIPNRINDSLILPTYENYKNKSDSIFLEKVLYQEKRKEIFLLIADIMGSKTSLILVLRNTELPEIIYAEQITIADTLEKSLLKNCTFFLLTSHCVDMCSEQEGLTIYTLDKLKLYKSFEGIKKEEFYNTGDPLCKAGVSYAQTFELILENNKVVLAAKKKDEKGRLETKKYYLKNYQFK